MRKKTYFTKFFVGAVALTFVLAPIMPVRAFFLVYDGQTCNINGVEMQGPCANSGGQMVPNQPMQSQQPMMGQQGQFDSGQMKPQQPDGNFGPNQMDLGGQPGMSQEQQEQMQKQQEERQLKDMKRNVLQMENNLKQFEKMMQKAEKSGTVVPTEIKEKLEKAKNIIAAIKSAATMEEMRNAGMEDFNEIMQDLEQARQDIFEKAQRLQDVKRGVKSMEQGIKTFEKQLATVAKKKVIVPQEIANNVAKLKDVIAKIKVAQTWDEVEAAGLEDMQDMMQTLDQSRQQLEILARWPQTLKQVNQELKRLTTELKRSKSISDRLMKKSIDVSGVYAEFEAAVNKLTSVRDEAANDMNTGKSDDAFDLLQNNFFGQTQDVWEFQRVIQTMNNLGQFTSQFKQGVNQAQNQIKMLQRKKIDVVELQDLLNQSKTEGNEVLALMKIKSIDTDAIMSGIQDLENLRQDFDSKMGELTGAEGGPMPWEQGPQQFQKVEMSPTVMKMMPAQTQRQTQSAE